MTVHNDRFARIRSSRLGTILVLAVTAAVVLAGVWLVNSLGSEEPTAAAGKTSSVEIADTSSPAPKVGQPAPTFAAKALDGQQIDVTDLSGKPLWLVFNATWCSNCRAEIPDIQTMQERYGDQISIVSVYVNDSPSKVVEYSTQLGLTFPQVPDPDTKISSAYRIMGVPAHYFILPDGTIESISVGALSEGTMEENIKRLLGN